MPEPRIVRLEIASIPTCPRCMTVMNRIYYRETADGSDTILSEFYLGCQECGQALPIHMPEQYVSSDFPSHEQLVVTMGHDLRG